MTKLGWARLAIGIFLLFGIARFIYMLDHGGNHSTEWYAAGSMMLLLLVNVMWSLAALRRPYYSLVVQIIFLIVTYLGFGMAGGLVVVLIPVLVLSTIWCAVDFMQFKNRGNVQLNILNAAMFIVGLASSAYLLSLTWWLTSTGKSPVG